MFFQREGLHVFIGQILRRVHDHTCITYRDAQEILPLCYDFLFGQRIQKNTSLIKVREAILPCIFLLYQSSMTPMWRISSLRLCAPLGDHKGLNWCPPTKGRLTTTQLHLAIPPHPPLVVDTFGCQTSAWVLDTNRHVCKAMMTTSRKASKLQPHWKSELDLTQHQHWHCRQTSIGKSQRAQYPFIRRAWKAYRIHSGWLLFQSGNYWEAGMSLMPGLLTTCLWRWCHEHY